MAATRRLGVARTINAAVDEYWLLPPEPAPVRLKVLAPVAVHNGLYTCTALGAVTIPSELPDTHRRGRPCRFAG